MSIVNDNTTLAQELIRYCKLGYDRHLVGAAGGNISVRVPGKNLFLVTASGIALRDVAADNIVVVDNTGKVIEGPAGLKPSKEISFHLSIYNVKPDINAVVHVHPAYTTAFTIAGVDIPLCTVSAKLKLRKGQQVAQADPGSKELRDMITQSVASAPPETTVLLMERHGLVAYRAKLSDAFDDAELVEDTARIAYLSDQLKKQ